MLKPPKPPGPEFDARYWREAVTYWHNETRRWQDKLSARLRWLILVTVVVGLALVACFILTTPYPTQLHLTLSVIAS